MVQADRQSNPRRNPVHQVIWAGGRYLFRVKSRPSFCLTASVIQTSAYGSRSLAPTSGPKFRLNGRRKRSGR
jgi:hypothetical protein